MDDDEWRKRTAIGASQQFRDAVLLVWREYMAWVLRHKVVASGVAITPSALVLAWGLPAPWDKLALFVVAAAWSLAAIALCK